MADHLHLYDGRGRCTRSVELRGDMTRQAAGLPYAVVRALDTLGYAPREWSEDERAGVATAYEETYVFRIKSDPMQRDMRAGGITAIMADIRRTAVMFPPRHG